MNKYIYFQKIKIFICNNVFFSCHFSCLNPIIYGFMSKNFRNSFISNIRNCCGCNKSQSKSTPSKSMVSGYSRRQRNQSVASFTTMNTTTQPRTQDTNVLYSTTNNKNIPIEISQMPILRAYYKQCNANVLLFKNLILLCARFPKCR